jgi:hypothetical protein
MRVHARVWVLSLICGVLLGAVFASSALAVAEVPLVEKFVATNCKLIAPKCGEVFVEERENPVTKEIEKYSEPKAEIKESEAIAEGEVQAGGRVPFGVTDFKVLTVPGGKYSTGTVQPTLIVTHIRTDVAPGLATNPFAVPMCTMAQFGTELVPGFFTAPSLAESPEGCGESEIGTQDATVFAGPFGDLALKGKVYDLEAGGGETLENGQKLAALYGVALELPIPITKILLKTGFEEKEAEGAKPGVGGFPTILQQEGLEAVQYFAHTLIKGNVEWGKEARGTGVGDFHDFFEIEVSPKLPLIRSRLSFVGTSGDGGFITNATSCPGNLTTSLKIRDLEGNEAPVKTFTTPIGLTGCNALETFEPKFALTPASTLSDSPNEFTAEATEEHEADETDVSQVKSASFTLPEGMTLNPSAAAGLEACTTDQAHQISGGVFGEPFGVECPSGSKIGTVSLNVPTLPDGTLTGNVYLASGSKSGTITEPPYDIYVVANSQKYGVSVRLFAETMPNLVTGQLTTSFNTPPEQPFTNLKLNFDRGALAPIANPLLCGTPQGSASFTPTSGQPVATSAFGVNITGCASTPPPFALTQGTENEVETAGSHTSYSFNLARSDGQQYLNTIKTSLPLGLVGAIPDVTLCEEAAANAGTCGAASKIGTVTVAAGSGSSPFSFKGSAYMTGPFNGAPYGMSIVVPAIAGPFNLGPVVTRATIKIDKTTAQVTAESVLPTIVKGIPLRLRSINLNINRQGFLYNPTNCTTQATLSTLTSTEGATQTGLSSPFTVTGCQNLKLAPKFAATTSAKVSRANGTSLVTTLTQVPGESNIKSVKVQLPRQLPSRDSTLKQACLSATFEADPGKCPIGSNVGTAEAVTPTLPGTMKGKAYFVSHGGAAFPDLDLVLEGQGVQIILVGNTDITNGITTTTFASAPDVPVTSVKVNLPAKSNSAVGGFGDLCHKPLVMPTTITGQNGKVTKQNTIIAVSSCGVKVVGRKVVGNTAFLTIQTFAAGRISGSGKGVKTTARSLSGASKATTLKVPLSSSGRGHRKPLKVKIRVGFAPKKKGAHSTASVTVTYR